ncbi:hypothetical protein [Streptomyces axinellae]
MPCRVEIYVKTLPGRINVYVAEALITEEGALLLESVLSSLPDGASHLYPPTAPRVQVRTPLTAR